MFPVVSTLWFGKKRFDSSKDTAIRSAIFPSHLLAIPGNTFCSWMRIGMRRSHAENAIGAEAYPPTPTTRLGRLRIKKHIDCAVPTGSLHHDIQRLRPFLPSKPEARIVFNLNPARGRTLDSIPCFVPAKVISISISLLISALASAIPRYK